MMTVCSFWVFLIPKRNNGALTPAVVQVSNEVNRGRVIIENTLVRMKCENCKINWLRKAKASATSFLEEMATPLPNKKLVSKKMGKSLREMHREFCSSGNIISISTFAKCRPPWGVKVWELRMSKTGYCLNFDVYTGRVEGRLPEFGLGHRVVMNMMQPYLDRQHHVYFDRFFASPKLTDDLGQRGTYSCCTVMLNRQGLPAGTRKMTLLCSGKHFPAINREE